MPEETLPQIFRDMIEQAESLETLSSEVVEEYCALIGEDMSFLPELVNAVGPVTFRELVRLYGGRRFTLPTADVIIERVKNSRRGNAKS